MRRNMFVSPRIPPAISPSDIEFWTQATHTAFRPFVRRRAVLTQHRHVFRVELLNLLPILADARLTDALLESVRLCRMAIYSAPRESFAHQIALFPETSQADERWLSLVASTIFLDPSADLADRASQLMTVLDTMVEGCLRPRLAFLFGFAHCIRTGAFPEQKMDLGMYIAQWPDGLADGLRGLMNDPFFGLPISQWRNIASHKNYRRVGHDLFEATYGKNQPKSIQYSFSQLQAIVEWVLQLLAVCRMAQVIIDIEFMRDLKRMGLRELPIRLDAFLIGISHNLRMVGFSYVGEERDVASYEVLYHDDLVRNPRDAMIHASQILDQLSLAVSSDIGCGGSVQRVSIGLLSSEGVKFASASVDVEMALRFLDRDLTLEQYANRVDFWFAPDE